MTQPSWALENELLAHGHEFVAGVDEAGRGALAGPVVVAAVVLPRSFSVVVDDSKRLSPVKRAFLAHEIRRHALAYHVELGAVDEILTRNILGATLFAAQRALNQVRGRVPITATVTDYLRVPTDLHVLAPPKADQRSVQVAAASILAKVVRDHYMVRLAKRYPNFGFERHKGYSAPVHLRALLAHGPCPEHRARFAPVAAAVQYKRQPAT